MRPAVLRNWTALSSNEIRPYNFGGIGGADHGGTPRRGVAHFSSHVAHKCVWSGAQVCVERRNAIHFPMPRSTMGHCMPTTNRLMGVDGARNAHSIMASLMNSSMAGSISRMVEGLLSMCPSSGYSMSLMMPVGALSMNDTA